MTSTEITKHNIKNLF